MEAVFCCVVKGKRRAEWRLWGVWGSGFKSVSRWILFPLESSLGTAKVFFVLQVYQLFLIYYGTLIRQDHIIGYQGLRF